MVAELREADAPPEVRDIYAEIRAATGVPLVNLIWRHMATMPGVLPWAWGAVRQALWSGAVSGAGDRVLAGIAVPGLAPIPLDPGEAEAAAVVQVYNRGNLTNLLILTALLRTLEDAGDAAADDRVPQRPAAAPPAMLPAIPPLPRLKELEPRTAELVHRLAALHLDLAPDVIPSLYLHLALWPALLARLEPGLARRTGDGSMAAARAQAIGGAEREAAGLRPLLASAAPLPAAYAPALRSALAGFTRQVIPEMVPVGLALAAAFRQS